MRDIKKLPKWAQKHIEDLERGLRNKQEAIELLKGTIVKPDWHDHEFFELRHDKEFGNRRYICANAIWLTAAGLEIQMIPREHSVTIHFDVDHHQPRERYEEAVIVPAASNSLQIQRMKGGQNEVE